jgi:hypothetical protein
MKRLFMIIAIAVYSFAIPFGYVNVFFARLTADIRRIGNYFNQLSLRTSGADKETG